MFFHSFLKGQEMAIGSWKSHFSYADGRLLAEGNGTIFCAATHGLFSIKDDVLEVIDKNKGLSGESVSALNIFEEPQV